MMKRSARHQSGLTLLELLLTVGLLGLLLAGLYGILNSWTERAIDRQAASDMLRVRTAAHDYILANFDTFKTNPPNIFVEVPVADLKPNNYLPSGYVPLNAFRQTIRIFRRNLRVAKLDKTGTPVLDGNGNIVMLTTIEVVIASDNPPGDTIRIGNKRMVDTSIAGGPAVGVVSDLVVPGETFTNMVRSMSRAWGVPRAALLAAGYTAVPDTQGGYLAAYDLVSSESSEANEHWLYRVPITGRPELNRMATNLIMNKNQLQNVGTIVADKYSITGNAAFRGQTQGGSTDTAQGMTVEQALRVNNAGGVSRINMKTGSCTFSAPNPSAPYNRTLTGTGCAISGGEMQTVGENRVDPSTGAVITQAGDGSTTVADMTADGNVVTDYTNVANTTDVAGISTFDTVNGTNMSTSTTVVAPTTSVTGPDVTTVQFQAGNMGVGAGATVQNQLVAARIAPGQTHQILTNRMAIGNGAQLTGKLGASNVTATSTLYLDNAVAPGGYFDPAMNHNVSCVPYGGRTYCEPRGQTFYLGNTVYDVCNGTSTGYSCNYYRLILGSWSYFGQCVFTRSVGTSGQAYEAYSCT